jgi:DNA-binding transcriptional regulator YdaS (Cro superfamily)
MIAAMELKNYIEKTGTTITAFARLLSEKCGKTVSRDVVYQWVNGIRPIPASYGHQIEEITDGAMTRQTMFPTKWMDIWPELASSSPATAPTTVTPHKLAGEAA